MENPGNSPTVTTLVIDSFAPGMMDESVTGAALDHFQLAEGRFEGRLSHAELTEARLDWGSYNLPVLATGAMPGDAVTLGVTQTPRGEGIFSGAAVRGTVPVLMTEGTELDYRVAGGSRWMAFQIERDKLERAGIALPPRSVSVIDAGGDGERLNRLIDSVVTRLRAIEESDDRILDRDAFGVVTQDALFAAFCNLFDAADSRRPVGRHCTLRLVRRVTRYLDEHYAEPVLVEAMCAIAGTSWKTLERAFRHVYGLTPKGYLTHLRLSRARRLLLNRQRSGDSVARIAGACGFTHLGRFAASYRALYGERPSET